MAESGGRRTPSSSRNPREYLNTLIPTSRQPQLVERVGFSESRESYDDDDDDDGDDLQ